MLPRKQRAVQKEASVCLSHPRLFSQPNKRSLIDCCIDTSLSGCLQERDLGKDLLPPGAGEEEEGKRQETERVVTRVVEKEKTVYVRF